MTLHNAADGPFLAWNATTVYLQFTPGMIFSDNIVTLLQNQGIPIPEPFFFQDISLLQQAQESPSGYHLRMEVDAIRLVERQEQ